MTWERLQKLAQAALSRSVHNWPAKLISIVLAFGIWVLISTADTSTTQRSFVLPLEVVGTPENVVPVGIPDVVEVSVSGPSSRIDRLRADLLQAVLEVPDTTGSFQRGVEVQVPQGVTLVSTNPSEVIGTLEGAISQEFPVRMAIDAPFGALFSGSVNPETIHVRGQASVVDRVHSVIVFADRAASGTYVPTALDEQNRPVSQVRFEPPVVTVITDEQAALIQKTVPLIVRTLEIRGNVEPSHAEVTVIGSPESVAQIEQLTGTVAPSAETVQSERYTAQVDISLPDGVFVVEQVTADVTPVPASPDPALE